MIFSAKNVRRSHLIIKNNLHYFLYHRASSHSDEISREKTHCYFMKDCHKQALLSECGCNKIL